MNPQNQTPQRQQAQQTQQAQQAQQGQQAQPQSSQKQEIKREEMEVDLLIVGGGVAGLSAAYHYRQKVKQHNEQVRSGKSKGEEIPDPMVVVLEKGKEIGAHSLSGAVLDTTALEEMIPDFDKKGAPLKCKVVKDKLYYLTDKKAWAFPFTPPSLSNKGKRITSISQFNRWLSQQCEQEGVHIFPSFSAVEVLYEKYENQNDESPRAYREAKVVGLRTGDKGIDKEGNLKANFEPGMEIKSKLTLFADGTRSPIFKQVIHKLNLQKGKNPTVFEEGVKEILQLPKGSVEPGHVFHTMGYPLKKGMGGTFIYTLPGDRIILGLVVYLDSPDPLLDPHRHLQELKSHPWLQKKLQGAKVIAYGGKTLPAGGWHSMSRPYGHGFMACGDTVSMVNVKRLKGIHLAMKSGMLAAETALEAKLANDYSAEKLSAYFEKIQKSFIKKELYTIRNFHAALSKGFWRSLPNMALQDMTLGRGLGRDPVPLPQDKDTTQDIHQAFGKKATSLQPFPQPETAKKDGVLFFDKLSSVYMTGTLHDENSPNHLHLKMGNICRETCWEKYRSPCTHFCPAHVYEMIPSSTHEGKKDLKINYTNCIHCQTCDIKCPYDNIDWNLPEGGGGPQYQET